MGKVAYHWNDPRHSAFDNSPLRLAAIAGADSFSYFITDPSGKPGAVKAFTIPRKYHFFDKPLGYLPKLIGDDDLLYADFDSVMLAVRGVPFAAMDPKYANTSTMLEKLRAVTEISETDALFCDVSDENFAVAFALPEIFVRETHAWFSDTQISHAMTALMTLSIKHSRNHSEPILFINISSGLAEFVLCHDGLLLFANHYQVAGSEDVLYYTLAILQNLHVPQDQVVVRCAGQGAAMAIPVLQSYLKDVQSFSDPEINVPADFPLIDAADLIFLTQCAS